VSRHWRRLGGIFLLTALLLGVGFAQGNSEESTRPNNLQSEHLKIVQRLDLKDYLQGIAWNSDGSRLATLSAFGSLITIWDTQTWRKLREISQYGGTYAGDSIAWTLDGMVLVSAGAKVPDDGIYSMNLWNPNTGELVKRIVGPPIAEGAWKHNQAARFVLSRTRSLLAMTLLHISNQLIIFDTRDWSIRRILEIAAPPSAQRGGATSFAFSQDEKSIAITNSRDLQLIGLEDGSVKSSVLAYDHLKSDVGPTVFSLKYNPDGNLLASAPIFFPSLTDDTGPVRIWDASDGRLIAKLPTPAVSFRMVDWSPDGSKLAAAGADGIVRVLEVGHDVTKAKLIFEFGDAAAGVVAFSPGGLLAAGGKTSVTIIK
jgi:WD40 repeat protein